MSAALQLPYLCATGTIISNGWPFAACVDPSRLIAEAESAAA